MDLYRRREPRRMNRVGFAMLLCIALGCAEEGIDCYGLDCSMEMPLSEADAELVCGRLFPSEERGRDERAWRCGGAITVGDRHHCMWRYQQPSFDPSCPHTLGKVLECNREYLEVDCEDFYELGLDAIPSCRPMFCE